MMRLILTSHLINDFFLFYKILVICYDTIEQLIVILKKRILFESYFLVILCIMISILNVPSELIC